MKQHKGKNAILYRRVSTTDQKKYGGSLSSQKDSLREFCRKNEINIIKEYEEDFSAKNFDRPEWKKLNTFAQKNKKEIDYLLVLDWDRFSRNVYEALGVINNFNSIGIEVNCIDKWVNYNDPMQMMMQLMYLGIPEVDNKIRSNKVKIGMRQGLKEGRWNMRQPIGYIKGKDENGRPLMQVDKKKYKLIRELFLMFESGLYSQNQLLKMKKFERLKLSKSNLSRMLKNELYAGKIKIPANETENETIIDGLHEAIISFKTYIKVQKILESKRRIKNGSYNDILFMRGHLKCDKCGGNLTGSGSKSKTGKKHYYYHCNTRKGCNERFRINYAHSTLEKLLSNLKPQEEVYTLFKVVLQRHYETTKGNRLKQMSEIKKDIKNLEMRKENLIEKLMEKVINDKDYKNFNNKIDIDIINKKEVLDELENTREDVNEYLKFGLSLFKNLDVVFKKSNHLVKRKLLSSIFDEKLTFDGEKYRTPKFKKGVEYIYMKINELEKEINNGEVQKEISSRLVPGVGLEPTRTIRSTGF